MTPLPRARLIAYGGLGLPLAFAALPLYVHLAPFYSGVISLSLLGVILLALRFLDAAIDPLIGALFDHFPHPRSLVALSLPVLGLGWIGVFTLPESLPVVPWLIVMLTLTTVGYSLATVVHNSWGARLSNVPHERTRLFAAREGFGLLGVVLAAALPATLVIFFIDDVLKLAAHSGLFLVIYFLSGALGLPLWVRLAKRIGTLDAWLISMALSIAAFAGAFWLGAGDLIGYALVCAASGLALGADLALPPALVADMIDADPAPQPGAYYGLMSFSAKLTLALAAGLALPLLDVWGYVPGGGNLFALSATYALLPIVMKLGALIWFWRARPIAHPGVVPC